MTPDSGLDDAAWALLSEATHVYRDSRRSTVWLRHHLNRLTEPLRLAVTGSWQAGRSTLVNALVGEDVAPVEAAGARNLFTWYQDGPVPRATLCPARGAAYELPVSRSGRGLRVAANGWVGGDIDEVVIEWPTRALRRTHLIDAPPVTPVGADTARTAERVLREADAVIYLTRRLGEEDLSFLRLARDPRVAPGVQVLVVLSRADETAGGRIDALVEAKRVARRWRRDPRTAALCQDVLAVAPMLAHAGRTLTGEEYAAFDELARVPRSGPGAPGAKLLAGPEGTGPRPPGQGLEPHLLSTDRFTAADFPAAVDEAVRRKLLDRFGLFGVRLATTLVRTGCRTRTALADRLVRHSGLAELQESIAELFVDRRPALKARSALLALDRVLRSEPLPAAAYLNAELERLVAGAHEFRELRLLASLRAGRVALPDDLGGQARRLAGVSGGTARDRLGLPPDAPTGEVWTHAHAAVARWRAEPQQRGFNAAQRRAAEVVVRSCEGILAREAG